MHGQQQRGLRELAFMIAILAIAYGTDGEDDVRVLPALENQVGKTAQVVGALADRQLFFREQRLRPFLAVVHYLARLVQSVDVISAKCDEHQARHVFPPLDGVQYGGGIVHYAVWIDRGTELVVNEPLTDVVGEARPDKKHFLARLNREVGPWYVNTSPEFHHPNCG